MKVSKLRGKDFVSLVSFLKLPCSEISITVTSSEHSRAYYHYHFLCIERVILFKLISEWTCCQRTLEVITSFVFDWNCFSPLVLLESLTGLSYKKHFPLCLSMRPCAYCLPFQVSLLSKVSFSEKGINICHIISI